MASARSRLVGIDFGTSTTLVADRVGEGPVRVLPIGDVTTWMPSQVASDDDGRLVAGEGAGRLGPTRVVRSVKAALTSGHSSVAAPDGQVVDTREGVRAILTEGVERALKVEPTLLDDAEVYLGCPALWTGRERQLLVDVAHECGLDVDIGQIIDEPVAAGLHWVHTEWLRGGNRPDGRSVVFDAGGGTLDIAYLNVAGRDTPEMTVLSAEGRPESGDELDDTIFQHLSVEVGDRIRDPTYAVLLRQTARLLKETLSVQATARVPVGAPFADVLTLERSTLEKLFDPQLSRAMQLLASCVRGGLLRSQQPEDPTTIRQRAWSTLSAEIRHVALVGGLSQVPAVQKAIAGLVPSADVRLVDNPQESVVRGLVRGDSLFELNLPRPPVDIVVDYGPEVERALGHTPDPVVVYHAYSPLYTLAQLAVGTGLLGHTCEIPVPVGVHKPFTFRLRMVMPDRARTPVALQVRDHHRNPVDTLDGVVLDHDPSRQRPRLKLYTNGQIVVTTSRRSISARVTHWPTIRGPSHDYAREVQLQLPEDTSPSMLRGDDWRFQ